ncbi:hypothetical protein ES702_06355 [subsurface metagenome]
MSWESIKKYVGAAAGSLVGVWQADEATKAGIAETDPPVGSKDQYPGRATMIGGVSATTILLLIAAWYFLKR